MAGNAKLLKTVKDGQIQNIRFELNMDGIRSVIDSTLPRDTVRQMIHAEVEAVFKADILQFGEDRFVSGPGKWHLKGHYKNR